MGMFTKEQLRQFISENNIQTAGDVQNALKNLFAETLHPRRSSPISLTASCR